MQLATLLKELPIRFPRGVIVMDPPAVAEGLVVCICALCPAQHVTEKQLVGVA